MAELCPIFDSAGELDPRDVHSMLFTLAHEHNREFLAHGTGVSALDRKALQRAYGPGAAFARYDDMKTVGRAVFGGGFQWETPEASAPLYGDFIYAARRDPLSMPLGIIATDAREYFLSLDGEGNRLRLESVLLHIYGGHLVYADSGLENKVGYIDENDALYLYDDISIDDLEQRTCVFQKADNGHYIIRSCRETNSPGD